MHLHRDTQAAFRAALSTQDVPPGITAVGDLARRFSVYRNTVMHSLTDALVQRFPVVQRIVGRAFFSATAKVFVVNHPPSSPIIQAYGTDFPNFLATFPPAAGLPYLPDVALIEVLRGQAYHAADATPMSPDTFRSAITMAPEDAVLTLHPALRLATSEHPAMSVWRMNQSGMTPSTVDPGPEAALIFRRADNVIVMPVPFDAADIVAKLAMGVPLGVVARDTPPDKLSRSIATLLSHGLIVGVDHPQA